MKPLEIKQMRNYIMDTLIDQIMTGKLKNGDKLTQQEIARQTGLSRMPVREALQALEQEGFVRYLPNRHVAVIGASKKSLYSTFQILAAIEAEMASLIGSIDKISLSPLKAKLEQIDSGLVKGNSSVEQSDLEFEFHLEFAQLIENPYLENMHTKFLKGYFKYGIDHFPRTSKEIVQPLKELLSALDSNEQNSFKPIFEFYYNSLASAMIKGGNYE